MQKFSKIIILALIVVALLALFFYGNLGQYLQLSALKANEEHFRALFHQQPYLVSLIYALIYIFATALSLPGATLLTLLGGALFGLTYGVIIISFSSTIGATAAFLISRWVLKDSIQRKFGNRLTEINQGIANEGAFYLFTLRLIPAIPFFVINLVMGLTPMKASTFFLTSQAGMLAGTIVYVNAGTELAKIEKLSDILSPSLILSLVLLGLFPLVASKLIRRFRESKKI